MFVSREEFLTSVALKSVGKRSEFPIKFHSHEQANGI